MLQDKDMRPKGADKRLKIFTADLSIPESFGLAIAGCKGVFHVAAPMDFQDNEPEPVVTVMTVGVDKGFETRVKAITPSGYNKA
ncbi:hypothetical protein PTKIN_Ptkin15bG0026200 [Pterospermum kingtungense]